MFGRINSPMGMFADAKASAYDERALKAFESERRRAERKGGAKRQKTSSSSTATGNDAEKENAQANETMTDEETYEAMQARWELIDAARRENNYATNDLFYRGLPRPSETAAARAKRLEALTRVLEDKARLEWHPTGARFRAFLYGTRFKTHFDHTLQEAMKAHGTVMAVSKPFASKDEETLFEIDVMRAILHPPSLSQRMVEGFGYMYCSFADSWFRWQRELEFLCVKARALFLAEKLSAEKMDILVNMFERLNNVWFVCGDGENIWRGCLNALQGPEKFQFVCQEKDEDVEYSIDGASYWHICPSFVKEIHGDAESAEYKQYVSELRARKEEKVKERKRKEEQKLEKERKRKEELAEQERQRKQAIEAFKQKDKQKDDMKKKDYADWVFRVTGRQPVGYEAPAST